MKEGAWMQSSGERCNRIEECVYLSVRVYGLRGTCPRTMCVCVRLCVCVCVCARVGARVCAVLYEHLPILPANLRTANLRTTHNQGSNIRPYQDRRQYSG